MRNIFFRCALLALFLSAFNTAYAVNDDPDYPCFGVHSLGWLDAAFYWREGTTWYKLASNDFDSLYPYPSMGENYTCYLSADTADKETVTQGSVPAVCEAASSGDKNSCLVFQTKQYASDSNRFYRVNLGTSNPAAWLNLETCLGSCSTRELGQRIWDQMVYSTSGTYLITKIYTNHTDIQNDQSSWDPSASSWDLISFMRETEVQIRTYVFGVGYVWIWYDTDSRTDSFKQFRVRIVKGGGEMMSGGGLEETTFTAEFDDAAEKTAEAGAPLLIAGETVALDGYDGLFPALFKSTGPEDEGDTEFSSLKVEENDKGEAVALTVETVDGALGAAARILLEGKTIVAVNGIALYDLGDVAEQMSYLALEKIGSITFAE